ncbi:hypothetical protein OCU04_010279 [Sclerotinia nivalis]|uniref:Uncharacterized protein n=1 Tax=Sclerotinia nivalis TaxID=352851 RepID=A0A9X0AE75_9HELO|nr:hypothetical protein OCU04_010279 [Sclerotinia nivalis]
MVPPRNNPAPKKGTKEGNPWVPRVNGGSVRAWPSTRPTYDPNRSGGRTGSKRKNIPSSSSGALEELLLFKEDSTRPISGKDEPIRNDAMLSNRVRKAMVVIRAVKMTNKSDITKENVSPMVFDNLYTSFDLSSQVPQLKIHIDTHTVTLHVHNFFQAKVDSAAPVVEDPIFKCLNLGSDNPYNWSIHGVQSVFANDFNTPGLTADHALRLYVFGGGVLNEKAGGKVNEKVGGSFSVLNFIVKGRISPPRLHQDRVTNERNSEARALEFQKTLNEGRIYMQQGLWSIFNDHVSKTLGQRFEVWYTDPTKFLPREPWMAEDLTKKNEIQRYAAHEARNNFGSMAEWEIVLSAAVIHEVKTIAKLNKRYYDWGRDCEAFVKYVYVGDDNYYVQLCFDIPSHEDMPFPPNDIDKRTRFLVRPGLPTTAEVPDSEMKINEEKTGDLEKPEELGDEVKGEGAAEKVKVETDVKDIGYSNDDEYSWGNDALNPANISRQVICENFERYQRNALATDMMEDTKLTSNTSVVKCDYTHRSAYKPAHIMNADVKNEAVSENVSRRAFVTQNFIEMVYKARVLETENNRHFVIAFIMPKDKRNLSKKALLKWKQLLRAIAPRLLFQLAITLHRFTTWVSDLMLS